jgi:hypothetical protein
MKLVQKRFLKGIREFEIVDDIVNVRLKSRFMEEKASVMLTILNPEPEVNEPFLEFHSRVKCSPLLSLWIDNPTAAEFNAFVDELKRRARQEYNAFAGLKSGSNPEALSANVYAEPPEFGEVKDAVDKKVKRINVESIDDAIQMLGQYIGAGEVEPLLDALKALKANPQSESDYRQLLKAFDELGPRQGAVLTYAPYIGVLLSDTPS